jgi:hypothetical protein
MFSWPMGDELPATADLGFRELAARPELVEIPPASNGCASRCNASSLTASPTSLPA